MRSSWRMWIRRRVGADAFEVEVGPSGISVARGRTGEVDATVTGTVAALRAVMFDGTPLRSAVSAGEIEVHGDLGEAEQFFRLFSAPPGGGTP